jgi:hypothetical protein
VFRKPDGRRKWVKSLHRVISTHDVRALVSVKDRLYCGGVDTYLTLSNYHGRTVARSVFVGSIVAGPRSGILCFLPRRPGS